MGRGIGEELAGLGRIEGSARVAGVESRRSTQRKTVYAETIAPLGKLESFFCSSEQAVPISGCTVSFPTLPDELLLAALHHCPIGTMIVNRRHEVLLANRYSEVVLNKGDSLEIDRRGKIRAVDLAARVSFDDFLEESFSDSRAVRPHAVSRYLLARKSLPPASISATTWAGLRSQGVKEDHRTILYLRDPMVTPMPSHDVLRAWFGLTRTEAQLACAIVAGKTILDYSLERGVSLNTVKTQFQSILDKTNVHRQVDLVRLLGIL